MLCLISLGSRSSATVRAINAGSSPSDAKRSATTCLFVSFAAATARGFRQGTVAEALLKTDYPVLYLQVSLPGSRRNHQERNRYDYQPDVKYEMVCAVVNRVADARDDGHDDVSEQDQQGTEEGQISPHMVLEVLSFGHEEMVHRQPVWATARYGIGSTIWQKW